MELSIIIAASFAASLVTLFSGFGLGTMLTPVFVLFFPVEIAIALTGVVHFSNNIFKAGLFVKHTHWIVVLQFGLPSFIGAVFGAQLLFTLTVLPPIAEYHLLGKSFFVEPVKLTIALLMLFFAAMEFFPILQTFSPSSRMLRMGGFISGFFGGLSGHQGALRSAFLVRYGLAKEQFLATGIIIACIVDVTRLSLYFTRFMSSDAMQHWEVVLAAVLAAFVGAYAGSHLIKKMTIVFVQRIIAVMLTVIAAGLGSGML